MIYVIIGISLLTLLFGYMTVKALLTAKDLKEFDLFRYEVEDELGNIHKFVIEDHKRDYNNMKNYLNGWDPLCRVTVWQGDKKIDTMFLEDLF